MTFDEYQRQARRTQNRGLSDEQRKQHALFGLAAECGEILSVFQKQLQGHMVSRSKVKEELGDLLWFCAELADAMGVSLDTVAGSNIGKLRARYPEGFSEERSVHRNEQGG